MSVAQRRADAKRHIAGKEKHGFKAQPVEIEGRKIARTFWGDAWCTHLESFSDFENRLPRGRTYVRNGSVCHLEIKSGEIISIVSGSELYDIKITIKKLPDEKWKSVKSRSSGQIGSLLDLLKGKLSDNVMAVVTDRQGGLFPLPAEIKMDCSCPDWATMCKHVAATLYGVGARLDDQPELLFLLRGVDHRELIAQEASAAKIVGKSAKKGAKSIEEGDLADIFGIEMLDSPSPAEKKTGGSLKRTTVLKATAPAKPAPAAKATTAGKTTSKVMPASGAISTAAASGKTMRDLRHKFEMSQSQFGELIGVSAASVSNWEKERRLRPSALAAIAPILKFSKRKAWNQLEQK